MSDDKESKNQENQSARPNSLRRLKVIGGSDFDAEFDNSSEKVQDHFITSHTPEREVDRISREELEARLSANKAEMESIASSIRADMALARETPMSSSQISPPQLTLSLQKLTVKWIV